MNLPLVAESYLNALPRNPVIARMFRAFTLLMIIALSISSTGVARPKKGTGGAAFNKVTDVDAVSITISDHRLDEGHPERRSGQCPRPSRRDDCPHRIEFGWEDGSDHYRKRSTGSSRQGPDRLERANSAAHPRGAGSPAGDRKKLTARSRATFHSALPRAVRAAFRPLSHLRRGPGRGESQRLRSTRGRRDR